MKMKNKEKRKIVISAAEPDYENFEYLPRDMIDKGIIINENGNNSIAYPHKLKKCREFLNGNRISTWYEYVPAQIAPPEKRAIVISLHGGLMEGWGQAVYSTWTKIAEREGCIAVFPDAGIRKMWMIDYDRSMEDILTAENESGVYLNKNPRDINENEDVKMLLALIEHVLKKYEISQNRVYIHGMSMGALMASMMARYFGNIFAGAAFSGALASPLLLYEKDGSLINKGGKIPVCQSHMELDQMNPGAGVAVAEVIAKNRKYWLRINECNPVPRISVRGQNNIAYYSGKADYIFREVKNRDHGQTIDEAEKVWTFWSHTSKIEDESLRIGDEMSVAFAEGCGMAFAEGKKEKLVSEPFYWTKYMFHGQNGNRIARGKSLMVSVNDLCRFFHAEIIKDEDQKEMWIQLQDGREIEFAQGNIACVIDNSIKAMTIEAVRHNEMLYISCEWFAGEVMNCFFTECEGVIYITDHYAELSQNMAYLIKELLN